MDLSNKILKNKYDRVMPRVGNQSGSTLKSSSFVTRHDIPSSTRFGAKTSVSCVSSAVFSDLPIVLNDYVPEASGDKVKKSFVVKPRRTIKSLDPALSPHRTVTKSKENVKSVSNTRFQESAPALLTSNGHKWSDTHLKQCHSSRSHSRLKELKSEIRAFHETEKLMRLRSDLYKKCGVVLDDVGNVAVDKEVQVEDIGPKDTDKKMEIRAERYYGEDARTPVSYQQMRSANLRYPVDRYLVECSKNFEMVNIIGDEIWNTEPALKPEDEIILRKLHEMLQSTADDLKLLSGELSKYREPGVQVVSTPTPLDEEFNEKVHIEEIVNAKFHGYKLVEKPQLNVPNSKPNNVTNKTVTTNSQKPIDTVPVTHPKQTKAERNLGFSRTKVIQIKEGQNNITKPIRLNNGKVVNAPTVAYNEFSFKYEEPKSKQPLKVLKVQEMPSINIRSELKEQKVLNIDIQPENISVPTESYTHNIAVVSLKHETLQDTVPGPSKHEVTLTNSQPRNVSKTIRKVSKLPTCESSESNNLSSDTQIKLKTHKTLLTAIKISPKNSARNDRKKINSTRLTEKRSNLTNRESLYLDDWRKKLNSVYSSSNLKKATNSRSKSKSKFIAIKQSIPIDTSKSKNHTEYIPYSKLTIGGVRASDIENEIAEIPNKNAIPLSPLLDKMLSSQDNSFSKSCSQKQVLRSQKVFTTSDENLLQEVLDIEKTVSETLSKNIKIVSKEPQVHNTSSESNNDQGENDSYADDFEDEKSAGSEQSNKQPRANETNQPNRDEEYASDKTENVDSSDEKSRPNTPKQNYHNLTYTKMSNLTVKNKIDVFEFVHSVDTQDSATQSQTDKKISLKETQTSPKSDEIVQPIHNNLWPTLDPKGEVEKLFKLEKDFIKQLIVEEYGDLIEKNVAKPSTSKQIENVRNVTASQKNTQTSPARVKHVMTSPTRTKTRPTSPFTTIKVDHNTSPMIFITNEDNVKIDIDEDLGISVNLSSPRFSLRLPQNTKEVLSNLTDSKENKSNTKTTKDKHSKNPSTTSSSIEADSSEISSLGEIRLRKNFGKIKIHSDSESISSTSSSDVPSGILPSLPVIHHQGSEGEMSLSRKQRVYKRNSKSEGEASLGLL